MAFVKRTLTPINTRVADALFDFEEPYIQSGIISGKIYTAESVSYGLPKPSYLQVSANSAVVTVVADSVEPLRLVFALGLHDANTGGEVGAWRSFTSKTTSNNTITVAVPQKAWLYAEINENGEPNNANAWTIDYEHETAVGKTFTTSTNEPNSPITGDVWFDVTNNKLFVYDGTTSSWQYKKRVYLGEVGIGNNGYVYTVQSWFPSKEYATYQDSNYGPWYENPWRHYDGVSFTTNGQYTAIESSLWANNATIGQAVVGNQIAMNAIANSAASMDSIVESPNTLIHIANSTLALTTFTANTDAIDFLVGRRVASDIVANNATSMPFIANNSVFVSRFAGNQNAMVSISNSIIGIESISGSATSMIEVANSVIAMNTISSSNSTSLSTFANSATVADAVANSLTSVSILSNNELLIDSFAASPNAMQRIANSDIAMPHFANNDLAMSKIANNAIAMQAVAANENAMLRVATSTTAMTRIQGASRALEAIANSLYQDQILNGPNGTSFESAAAQSATILTALAGGSQGNVLFSLIADPTNYSTIVGNATYRNALIDSQSGPILATGGTVSVSGNYRVHTFNSGGVNFQTYGVGEGADKMEYLVVAGGGGGATYLAGGGGGGGYRTNVPGQSSGGTPGATEGSVTIAKNTAYAIAVGGGGAAATGQPNPSGSGSNSSIGTLVVSVGGGGGGGYDSGPGKNGGSGGGKYSVGDSGTGIPGQGHDSGRGYHPFGGGGGGGAGSVGTIVVSPSTTPTNGGTGRSSPITGSSVIRSAGGGGAGNGSGGSAPNGGAGNYSTAPADPASNAAPNRGGGGGGRGSISGTAGAGGSGVVVIRYPLIKT